MHYRWVLGNFLYLYYASGCTAIHVCPDMETWAPEQVLHQRKHMTGQFTCGKVLDTAPPQAGKIKGLGCRVVAAGVCHVTQLL